MKKLFALSIISGMIFIPCLSISGQKSSKRPAPGARNSAETDRLVSVTGPNEFASVAASILGDKILISWEMRREIGNMGFYIHRVDVDGDTIINEEIVFGSAAKTGRHPLYGELYAFLDSFGSSNSIYVIESIDLDGNRTFSERFAPRVSKYVFGRGAGIPGNADEDRLTQNSLESHHINLSKELEAEIARAEVDPDPDTHKWVMSRPGAKIDVKTEGIYRVPFAQLQSAGFDTNSDKTLWQLYRNGLEQAITVNDADSYIEFYGRGIETPETQLQGYFLVSGDEPGKRIENMVARPSTSSVTLPSYNQTSTYRERTLFLDTILNGDPENYWGRGIGANGTNVSFDLSNIDFNVPNATLELKVQGFSTGVHNVRVILNGQLLEPLGGVAQFAYSGTQTIPTSLLKDASLGQGSNVLNLASVGPSGDFNLFDTVNVSFARKHNAIQNTLKAYTANRKKTKLTGFTSADVRVFDITFENDPRLVTNISFQDQGGGSFGTELAATRPRVFFAAENSQILSPVAVVPNDGEVLATSSHSADLIIITHKNFQANAETWAAYREAQGFQAKVVDIEEIFNEFNFGSLSSSSIRTFLDFAYYNWATQPKYVLLVGDATRDPKNYTGFGNLNFVPTRTVVTVFTETGSDEWLADFNDDGIAELAIGRIPARTAAQVERVFNKSVNLESNLGTDPLSRGSLFAVDQFDAMNNIDFREISDNVMAELPSGAPTTVVERNETEAKNTLLSAINAGKYAVNFTGHGSARAWANAYVPGTTDYFFWAGTVPSVSNQNAESIFTMLTCLNGYFLFPDNTLGLAEVLLDHNNGGAVASWASTGLTSADVQEVMARRFYKKIGDGDIPRLGDLVKDAKATVIGGTDVRLSWALLGDPMLKVR